MAEARNEFQYVLSVDPQNLIALRTLGDMAAAAGDGVEARRCLSVRRVPDGAWVNFYDPIVGFTHEPGYRTRIDVLRQRVSNPPADGSSSQYRLLRVVSRERDP